MRLHKSKTFAAAATAILLGGCAAGGPPRPLPAGDRDFTVHGEVEYVDWDNNRLRQDIFPDNVVLSFPVVPGGIFGSPEGRAVIAKRLSGKMQFSIDFADTQHQWHGSARPVLDKWREMGLKVIPSNTRLARVGTFPFGTDGAELGAGGFLDTKTRDGLILIYVDRPCHITGNLVLGDDEYDHDINLEKRGFHWIRVQQVAPTRYDMESYSPPDTVNFMIIPTLQDA